MKKYRIEKETPPPPGDEQVNRHKDFGRLVANYDKAKKAIHKRPLYKDPRAFLGLLLIIIIVWLLLGRAAKEEQKQQGPVPDTTTVNE
jgi:hypothetical protein